ncbi:response regulator transcription factor [Aureibacillus halotolerans]|uniref:DNA-binding response OmpR family regulator n=1 Tax=Aureibacillus halotolerans TaxID=1508390 RepID=A0A4R6U0L4_9BACI|nr:response regulator transcription factor [Aureibacillus halotolerans]TDQ36594.1 DNA-binding response OmpR family regulator [Aureibacillus halotolerans]
MTKLLIIEDDEVISEVQKDYLEASGYEVDIATNGTDGVKMALEGAYDLLLLDLMLPGMDGYQICEAVREAKDIPILMISAKTEEIDKIRGFRLGADDYIVKPFSVGELVARVKAHLARFNRLTSGAAASSSQKELLQLGALRIDQPPRKVFVHDKEVTLTTKEYDLLLYLASHPNRVFSKEDLFERIWGLDSFGELPTVTVHVSRLREKIEPNPAHPQWIETVWGVGYRFKV